MSKKEGNGAAEQPFDPFVMHRLTMLQSAAWEALSPAAVKLLSRLEREHLRHKANRNGMLSVSYAEFRAPGLAKRQRIGEAIAELVQLGFLEVTRHGRMVGSVPRRSLYRLTFLPTADAPATNEWQSVNAQTKPSVPNGNPASVPKRVHGEKSRQSSHVGTLSVGSHVGTPSTHLGVQGEPLPAEGSRSTATPRPSTVTTAVRKIERARARRLGSALNGVRARLNRQHGPAAGLAKLAKLPWTAPTVRELPPDEARDWMASGVWREVN